VPRKWWCASEWVEVEGEAFFKNMHEFSCRVLNRVHYYLPFLQVVAIASSQSASVAAGAPKRRQYRLKPSQWRELFEIIGAAANRGNCERVMFDFSEKCWVVQTPNALDCLPVLLKRPVTFRPRYAGSSPSCIYMKISQVAMLGQTRYLSCSKK